MPTIRTLLFVITALLPPLSIAAETSDIVATIKPLHSLVSGVVGNTGDSELLLRKTASPHHFQLKPSQIKMLQNASIIFYIDERLETFLHRTFDTLPDRIKRVEMVKTANLTLLKSRTGGAWQTDPHEHGHHHHHHTEADSDDPHIWLDPDNAKSIVSTIAAALGDLYPENRNTYQTNARVLIKKISILDEAIKTKLREVQKKPFVVFHDAYQYFEHRYGLNALGSITFEPDEPLSPMRLKEIRHTLQQKKAHCIFREPQFPDRPIRTATEGLKIKIGTLDPLGASIKDGENLYFELLENLAENMRQCLE